MIFNGGNKYKSTNRILKTPFVYGNLEKQGWTLGLTKWNRGYISRVNFEETAAEIFVSGRGELFFFRPSWQTTQYKIRQYLIPPSNDAKDRIILVSKINNGKL